MPAIRKVVITGFGDESKLALVAAELPPPRAGEVQIAVQYSIVSGSDVSMRLGTYPFQKKPPLTPGYSVLGTVAVNGEGCERFRLGDQVACLTKYDGQADRTNQPERYLVAVPAAADPRQAVALVLDWVTAYQMLHHAARVTSGQKIFVHGLSGAVGGACLTLGKLQGAEVFGTASAGKHAALRALGAVPFDYGNKQWIADMQASGGADAVFDPLGYESFDESYAILRRGGILVGYGATLPRLSAGQGRSVVPMMLKLLSRNLAVWSGKRTTFFGVNRGSRNYLPDLALLFEWLAEQRITVPIKASFPLSDIQAAHREYASGRGMGSIVIEIGAAA